MTLQATGMDKLHAIEPATQGDRSLGDLMWTRILRLVDLPAGVFRMRAMGSMPGAPPKVGSGFTVRIPHPFRIGAVPVTQGVWTAIMGTDRKSPLWTNDGTRYFDPKDDSELPAVNLLWDEIGGADGFLDRLNSMTEWLRPEGQIFRVPTDVEWEYACRAGTTSRWSFGDDLDGLDAHAWTKRNSGRRIHPVGQKAPNPWGLYDMHGNVGELCKNPQDSLGLGVTGEGVIRGGNFSSAPLQCLSTSRDICSLGAGCGSHIGFRLIIGMPL